MAKKKKNIKSDIKSDDYDYITTELERIHPIKGDIFILNVDTDDPDILYSEDILESVEKLSDTLEELIGFKVPVLVFGTEIDLSILEKDEVKDLVEKLQSFLDYIDDDEKNEDTEHLTDQFE